MRVLLAGALVAVAFAGCLEFGSDDDAPGDDGSDDVDFNDWAMRALTWDDDHEHGNPSHHAGLTTPNFQILGRDPLVTDYHGKPSGTYYCGGVGTSGDGERTYAVWNSFASGMGVVVVDMTETPTLVGELSLPNTHIYDATITPDSRFIVLATSPLSAVVHEDGTGGGPDSWTTQATWTDSCGVTHGPEQDLPYGPGVMLVDLADPAAPAVADFRALPVIGAHSVDATLIEGTRFVLASTTNLAHDASTFSFYAAEETPLGGRLIEYGTVTSDYSSEVPDQNHPLINGHIDGTIQTHPVTGQTLAYLANWDGGMLVHEIVAPGVIVPVGAWNDYDPDAGSAMTGSIHEAYPLPEMWGDRHITVIGQEVGGPPAERPTGQVILLDTTDPAAPEALARWTLPHEVEFQGFLMFSTHYVTVIDETLFVSLYHGGVWAADASEEHWPELPSIGVFVPADGETAASGGIAPEVLDVLRLPDDTLAIADGYGGAYKVLFDPDIAVPAVDPWTQDAWIGVE